MGKKALSIKRSDIIDAISGFEQPKLIALPPNFFDYEVYLEDRDTVETDESFLQLIPYIVVTNGDHVFMYERGEGGDEDRLKRKLSIGLGGHVDCAPEYQESLLSVLQREAQRECLEEAKVSPSLPLVFEGMLYDPTLPVGRVHLGLLCRIDGVSASRDAEPGVINKARWIHKNQLHSKLTYPYLENWSRASADWLCYGDNPWCRVRLKGGTWDGAIVRFQDRFRQQCVASGQPVNIAAQAGSAKWDKALSEHYVFSGALSGGVRTYEFESDCEQL